MDYPAEQIVVCFDKAKTHGLARVEETLKPFCPKIDKAVLIPTALAKSLLPLDNSFHSDMERKFRIILGKTDHLVEAMICSIWKSYHAVSRDNFQSYYYNYQAGCKNGREN
jgi:hypothetical protein